MVLPVDVLGLDFASTQSKGLTWLRDRRVGLSSGPDSEQVFAAGQSRRDKLQGGACVLFCAAFVRVDRLLLADVLPDPGCSDVRVLSEKPPSQLETQGLSAFPEAQLLPGPRAAVRPAGLPRSRRRWWRLRAKGWVGP